MQKCEEEDVKNQVLLMLPHIPCANKIAVQSPTALMNLGLKIAQLVRSLTTQEVIVYKCDGCCTVPLAPYLALAHNAGAPNLSIIRFGRYCRNTGGISTFYLRSPIPTLPLPPIVESAVLWGAASALDRVAAATGGVGPTIAAQPEPGQAVVVVCELDDDPWIDICGLRYASTNPIYKWTFGSSPIDITDQCSNMLGQRYAKILALENISCVGIVVKGITDPSIRNRLKTILRNAGKRAFVTTITSWSTFSLGNLHQARAWVAVACPEETIRFLKQSKSTQLLLLTPFDVEVACKAREWTGKYSFEMTDAPQEPLPPPQLCVDKLYLRRPASDVHGPSGITLGVNGMASKYQHEEELLGTDETLSTRG